MSHQSSLTKFRCFHVIECWSKCKYEIVPGLCHNSISERRASKNIGGPYQCWGVTTCMRGGFNGSKLLGEGQVCWTTHAVQHGSSSGSSSCSCLCMLQRLRWGYWCTHQGNTIMLDMLWPYYGLCSLLNLLMW